MNQCPNCQHPIANTSEGCPNCKTKFLFGKFAYRSNKLDKPTKFILKLFSLTLAAIGIDQLVEYVQVLFLEFSNFNLESLIGTLFFGVLIILPAGVPLLFSYIIYFIACAGDDITEDITDDENKL